MSMIPNQSQLKFSKLSKRLRKDRPELRFLLIPHNASADADTRAEMSTIILSDLITLATAKSPEDLQSLRLIPPQKKLKEPENFEELANYRISALFNSNE